jgi:UDP-N-acetylglucosamine--N-acetylmuramyl-(pentapeptide) pyrophosphoryl-undecaprenol N-acetylglucosamine transferase
VISRAGANAICELLALAKPNLLIPLSANASRGDQILNAKSFKEHGYSMVIEEEEITPEKLLGAVQELYKNKDKYTKAMKASPQSDAVGTIVQLIRELSK